MCSFSNQRCNVVTYFIPVKYYSTILECIYSPCVLFLSNIMTICQFWKIFSCVNHVWNFGNEIRLISFIYLTIQADRSQVAFSIEEYGEENIAKIDMVVRSKIAYINKKHLIPNKTI